MIGGFAEYDAYAPLSIVDELALLMKQSRVRYRYEVHRSATGKLEWASHDTGITAFNRPDLVRARRDMALYIEVLRSAAASAFRMRRTHQRGEAATRAQPLPTQDRSWDAALDLRARAWRLARRLVLEQGRVDLARTRPHGVDTNADRARRAFAFAIKVD